MKIFSKSEKSTNEELLRMLQNEISDNSNLEDIVDVFERMCSIPIEEDLILFETGTYSFTGEPLFYFSLVRQFPNEDEEYYQIHVDVLYVSTNDNKCYKQSVWNDQCEESIFTYIKKSQEYEHCKDTVFNKVNIFIDET